MKNPIDQLPARQQQALKTRHKLLEAGKEVFLENGFQKATISQVIKKANTGYGTAYVYFKNKDELFITLMEDLMNQFYEVAEMPFKPQAKEEAYENIKKQVRLFLRLALDERDMMKVVKEAIGVSPEIEEKWYGIRERFIERISVDIRYAQAQKLAKKQLDPALTARGWFYSNEMFMWELVMNEEKYQMDDVIVNLTRMYTGGLYD
ncbi:MULTISPECIES: TetR/AcrR family transcriptional regulator [Cytobacillus]|uniref:TetR family transcriptional regulator n=1 Tax=Cytobacillus oceanisediminis 2691 TaxID=1196031 RepID=A0A160M7F2_9BACI|nr:MULTISPECIES: TetR/AcrR family transcriptional regulator [Cytobacillus]MBY0156593.1 TetR/AcrR family transcriptional regulator [Cytobacillus firmus]AND38427.1 TetR family transcriptional regulator [Cytobacillus oceanisediminis 2691]MCM3391089.1 TetR/AcrR family transcriptional regulator [Cytobacillus oceanisediminis]MCM3531037.1 TetR/AcrR family transcriptional regulator [Cytobacillus oceanisediminis]UQX52706.1 TetR/AcrR family transcriptional regulator [Cytobacillus pseudoceanisediminis]